MPVYREPGVAQSEYDLASSLGSVATLTPSAPPARRVLLVALEAMLAERTGRQLEREGYRVRLALNETEAIHLTRSSWPHLVVLDVSSSGSHDLSTFERLRSRSDVPIVMLSPLADEEDRVNGLNRGADDFLPRPVSPRSSRPGSPRCCDEALKHPETMTTAAWWPAPSPSTSAPTR